ncbi:hypothetical protein DFH09DRAFT_1081729 [Mycena vulgaris]|nr:hypothetical protein DFH09DRAFT_1081729 [Mycena vulgaris]
MQSRLPPGGLRKLRLWCYGRLPSTQGESRTKRKLNESEVEWMFERVMTGLIPCDADWLNHRLVAWERRTRRRIDTKHGRRTTLKFETDRFGLVEEHASTTTTAGQGSKGEGEECALRRQAIQRQGRAHRQRRRAQNMGGFGAQAVADELGGDANRSGAAARRASHAILVKGGCAHARGRENAPGVLEGASSRGLRGRRSTAGASQGPRGRRRRGTAGDAGYIHGGAKGVAIEGSPIRLEDRKPETSNRTAEIPRYNEPENADCLQRFSSGSPAMGRERRPRGENEFVAGRRCCEDAASTSSRKRP